MFHMDGPDDEKDLFAILTGTTEQLALRVRAFGANDWRLDVVRGSEVLATTEVFPADGWKLIELKARIDPSSGFFEVRVDERVVIQVAGINTANAGTAHADRIEFGVAVDGAGAHARIDDVYILDATGIHKDYLGEVYVEGLLPVADGALTEWSATPGPAHAVQVDDPATAASDDDTTYVRKTASGQRELFQFGRLSQLGGEIVGVAVIARGRCEGAGSSRSVFTVRDRSGALREGADLVFSSTSYADKEAIHEPSNARPRRWTLHELNEIQMGLRSET
jgi:hypothetical protein